MAGDGKREVAGVILHRNGRVLMQHRDDKPDIVYPNCWAIFGGHMEPGEEPEQAARREAMEELELRLDGLLTLVHHDETAERRRWIFAARLEVDPETLTLHEGQAMALLTPAEMAERNTVPLHREIIVRFLSGLEAGGG